MKINKNVIAMLAMAIAALSGCSNNEQTSSDLQTISSETNLQDVVITTQTMPDETIQNQTQTTPTQLVTTTTQAETNIISQKPTNTTTQTTTQATTESTTVSTSNVVLPTEYPALTPLTNDENLTLKDDFAKYKSSVWTNPTSDEMTVMYYYGKYNGNEVVVMYSIEYAMTDDEKKVKVGEHTFTLPSGSLEILLHIDNDFIDIQTAYATGYLGDEDIAAIYYYSTLKATPAQATTESTTVASSGSTAPTEYPVLTPLTNDETLKLKEDFAKYKSSVWTNPTSDEMTVMYYYGKYNGNEVVVMYSIEYAMTDDEKKLNVGNYAFLLPSGSLEILLHIDNDFIDIQTAYAAGYLNDEDMDAIYYYSTNK